MNKFRYFPHIFSGTMVSQMRTIGVIVLVILLGACEKDSTPVGPDTVTYSPPKAGSTFRYANYGTDTTNSQPIENTRDTSIQTFLQTGMTYNGKTNVSQILEVKGIRYDTTYISYETNGDISLYVTDGLGHFKWSTLPIGSKNTASVTFTDTTTIDNGDSARVKFSFEVSYIGTETLSINGKSTSVVKLKESIILAVTKSSKTETRAIFQYGYFAPSIGYIVKTEQPVQPSMFFANKEGGSVQTLFDYTLK